MNYSDALQLIGATILLTLPLGLLLGHLGGHLPRLVERLLPPRYLQIHPVRRRQPADAPASEDHEPR
ncbi:cellulose biosynthesis protein BcsF [Azotobacter chroococcum]|jgi:cellulose biosynthesis operon protein BcsF/YhjT|uniref:Cellulose biosynthesis operon protein BcsF/YhjT n=1 Tax=Azotobacter chroococcum TaxID=353 RepID=A0A4R1PR26_9GAMM|nr:cellulose biosynthesis protein BcsF [Azotobacter chroococcum]TBV96413.1 cellulose biosynthesis protein BcsF [Azotobacter chroococcum]TCL34033.1 cellulose biosynthesis operon protein BcsF/YhjT [Azotobacter chroococcum]